MANVQGSRGYTITPQKIHSNEDGMSEINEVKAPKLTGGKGVHVNCYHKMLKEFEERHPGNDPPGATARQAERTTICPQCRRVISPGQQIVITSVTDWKLARRKNND
jgi:hypothetical protein